MKTAATKRILAIIIVLMMILPVMPAMIASADDAPIYVPFSSSEVTKSAGGWYATNGGDTMTHMWEQWGQNHGFSFTFTGTAIKMYANVAPRGEDFDGVMDISIDGGTPTRVLMVGDRATKAVVFEVSGLTEGTHTISGITIYDWGLAALCRPEIWGFEYVPCEATTPDPEDPEEPDEPDVFEETIAVTGAVGPFGETSWTDYIIEFDTVGFTSTGTSQWPCLKIHFREKPGNNLYRLMIFTDGNTNIDGIVNATGWGNYIASGSSPALVGNDSHYKIVVEGANVKVFVNNAATPIINYTETDAGRLAALATGQINIAPDGTTGTIENFSITRITSTPPTPPDPEDEGEVFEFINEPTTVVNGDFNLYGEYDWSNYIIENTIHGLANTTGDWHTYLLIFRAGPEGKYYYLNITPNGQLCLQENITNGHGPNGDLIPWMDGPSAGSIPVTYRIEVIDNVITAYANDAFLFNYTEDYNKVSQNPWGSDSYPHSIFESGKVGYKSEFVTCIIDSYIVTNLDSTPGSGVVIEEPGPFGLPYAMGDATWKDYEAEFDYTPTQNGSVRITIRGGAYYSLIDSLNFDTSATAARNIGLSNASGAGTAYNGGAVFTLDQPMRMRFRAEGGVISLYVKNYGSDAEVKVYEVDTAATWGSSTLVGGMTFQADGWGGLGDAIISNIVIRDLSGTIVPPDPQENEGEVVVDLDSAEIALDDFAWYGDASWKNYTIEATIKNLTTVTGQYPNFQIRFRAPNTDDYYYYQITPGGWTALQDSITWGTIGSYSGPAANTSTSVNYKIEVMDGNIKVYAGNTEVPAITHVNAYTALEAGQVGWASQGTTLTLEDFKVTLFDVVGGGSNDPNYTTGPIKITPVRIPAAGVYPQGLFKHSMGSYTETITWSPAIQSTFDTNTIYKAIYTLVPTNANYFNSTSISDIAGIPLVDGVSAAGEKVGNNYVVTITYPATGSTKAVFEEFKNTLFYDNFTGNSLDLKKWQDPVYYQHDRQGGSKWVPSNVTVGDGVLSLRYAKEDANRNFISASAVRSRGQFENTYGYYEAKIKYPAIVNNRSGAWGAFWLYNDSVGQVGDGGIDGTEIDIIELSTVHRGGSNSALHWDGYGSAHKSTGPPHFGPADYASPTGIYDGDWHIYGFEWTPYEYVVYIDGKEMWRVNNTALSAMGSGICQNPLYIKLSIESQGDGTSAGWGGPIAPGVWEDYMLVDYVAVYDRPKVAGEAPVFINDYVTLDLDTDFDGAQAQVKATLTNVDIFGQNDQSGTVSLVTPAGIIAGSDTQVYTDLAYGQSTVLYFDIDVDAFNALSKAHEVIKFNYTVDGIAPVGSEETKFGYVEAARVVDENDGWKNSATIDFGKGIIDGGALASTLNPSDLSATGKLAWDDTYLYANIVVTDDVHSQTKDAGSRWEDDGVQISIGNGRGHREVEFTLSSDLSTVYQHCYSNSTGASGGTGVVAISMNTMVTTIVRDDVAKTTTYKIALNWAYFGITDPTTATNKISICVNDNDGSGRKFAAYFDGIATSGKGQDMGYLVLMPEVEIPMVTKRPLAVESFYVIPSEVTGTPEDGEITFTWVDPNGEESAIASYELYVTNGGNKWLDTPVIISAAETTVEDGVTSATVSFADLGIIKSNAYDFRIKAINDKGATPFIYLGGEFRYKVHVTVEVLIPTAKPKVITNFEAVLNDESITFAWVNPNPEKSANSVESYQLFKTSGGSVWLEDAITIDAGDVTVDEGISTITMTFEELGIAKSGKYDFRIKAANIAGAASYVYLGGENRYKVAVEIESLIPTAKPKAITDFNATANEDSITFSWTDLNTSGTAASSYELSRTNTGNSWQTPVTIDASDVVESELAICSVTISYEDLGIDKNGSYDFRIKAANEFGVSPITYLGGGASSDPARYRLDVTIGIVH